MGGLSSDRKRKKEALKGADSLSAKGTEEDDCWWKTSAMDFSPTSVVTIKEYFEVLKKRVSPDLVLTHYRDDLHQDHRLVSDLTWNTFRRELILEYEIPEV